MKKPFVLLWTLVAGLFLFFWVYLPSLSKYRDLKTRQEELAHQIETLEVKIKSVKEERDLLKNDVAYLEKVIRDELGLVKPGEIVYKFVPEETPEAKPEAAAAAVPEVKAAVAKAETVAVKKTQEAVKAASKQGIEVVAKPIPKKTTTVSTAMKSSVKSTPKKTAASSEPSYPRKETR